MGHKVLGLMVAILVIVAVSAYGSALAYSESPAGSPVTTETPPDLIATVGALARDLGVMLRIIDDSTEEIEGAVRSLPGGRVLVGLVKSIVLVLAAIGGWCFRYIPTIMTLRSARGAVRGFLEG